MNPVNDDEKIRIGCYQCRVYKSTDKYIDDDVPLMTFLVNENDGSDKLDTRFLPCISNVYKNCEFAMQFAVPATAK